MAITPDQARQRAAPKRKIIKSLEKRINAAIVGAHRSGCQSESFWSEELDNSFVREEIEHRYRSAGWEVDYTDNQHDGRYLSFSRARAQHTDQRDALVAPYER